MCPENPLARSSRTLQPLHVMRHRVEAERSQAVFHFHSRGAESRRDLSRSLGRSMSFPHKTFIYSKRSRSVPRLLGRLALETGHEDPPRASALAPRSSSFPSFLPLPLPPPICPPPLLLRVCNPVSRRSVFISPGIPRWLGAFRPLTLLSAPRKRWKESSLGPVAAGAIEIGVCGRREIYRDSIILFRTRRPAVNIGLGFYGTGEGSNNESITPDGGVKSRDIIRYRTPNLQRCDVNHID